MASLARLVGTGLFMLETMVFYGSRMSLKTGKHVPNRTVNRSHR
ncbi:MAG: hypothetical protein QOD83_1419 [Solirubrobacteraceae bacterium]|jgi:hypothetical protein|nr:hypothetical protein [Solirubrobacteraceae bacterium]